MKRALREHSAELIDAQVDKVLLMLIVLSTESSNLLFASFVKQDARDLFVLVQSAGDDDAAFVVEQVEHFSLLSYENNCTR